MTLVVGLGRTGLSCARFLAREGVALAVADTREAPPGLAELRRELPQVPFYPGAFDARRFAGFERLVVSPGVALAEPAIRAARARGCEVIGDVELFARRARAPVVAITGSNGKSTVTTLVALALQAAGRQAPAGANLGCPALELLREPEPDCYVLELSSFQLESVHSLRPAVAAVLNVSPDHLDRYPSQAHYAAAKTRIYRNAQCCVYNTDDPLTRRCIPRRARRRAFGLGVPRGRGYGVRREDGREWLVGDGGRVLALEELRLAGRHNVGNALAAVAVCDALGVAREHSVRVLREFAGLPHRMQHVATRDGVRWIDDSKGTNVGACVAALQGLDAPVVLIAGGLGKGADFAPLRAALARHARAVVLIGRDAPVIAAAARGVVAVERAASMPEAVAHARRLARSGDCVLLSPACASFDMFDDYQARGEAFARAVRELPE